MRTSTGFVCLFAAFSFTAAASSINVERELRALTQEKRQISTVASELEALARNSHLTSWESHAIHLSTLKDLVNASGKRLARIEQHALGSIDLTPVRSELADVARRVQTLKLQLAENQLVLRMPAYYTSVMGLVKAAEQSHVAAERLLASRTTAPSSQRNSD